MNELIDNTLHRIFLASFNYTSLTEGKHKHNISDDLNWYIWTGRASASWIKALAKANPNTLLNHIAKAGWSTDDHIASTTAYLKRYCGYKS